LAAVPLLAVTAGLASALPAKEGGIFRVGTTGASVQIDPQLSYVSTGWWLEYATAAKLYNYPDKVGQAGGLLRPEVASGYTVSSDARTYTFTIRKGFRFSDGSPVTAKNFQFAINRTANHDLASPGAPYITDPNGTDIVGARAVNDGHATRVSGVRVERNRLIIRLTKPDASFLDKLAMPFFQATSLKLPLKTEVTTGYPSAGPYYFARNEVNSVTSLRRNPYWHGNRPRHLTGVDVRWNLNEQGAYEATLANELDEGPIPFGEREAVAARFGVNKTRLFSKPLSCLGYIAFNNSNGIFAGNPQLRQAVNWALNRRDYVSHLSGQPWAHLLAPLTPGIGRQQPFGLTANLAKARKLAAAHFRDGHVVLGYRSSGTVSPALAQLLRRDLINLGFNPAEIELKGFSGAEIYDAMGRGDVDVTAPLGWCTDYPVDPIAQLRLYVSAGPVGVESPTYQAKLDAVARLTGAARLRAVRKLELEIARKLAPIAPLRTYNNLYLFSSRVDPRSLVYQPVYTDWSIPALRLK
jgi:peptide/nickel transport system substrate-binding protein